MLVLLPSYHHLLFSPCAMLGQPKPVVLPLLPLLRALVRAGKREDRCVSTQQ